MSGFPCKQCGQIRSFIIDQCLNCGTPLNGPSFRYFPPPMEGEGTAPCTCGKYPHTPECGRPFYKETNMSGASLNQPELDAAIAGWIAMGFEVIRADDKTLLLDIDSEYAQAQFDRVFPCVQEHFGIAAEAVERWTSKSGNTHIRITLQTPQPWAVRYALEAMLGSDGMRGTLGILQMMNGCDEASMLVRPLKVKEPIEVGDSF